MIFIFSKLRCAASEILLKYNNKKLFSSKGLPDDFSITCHTGALYTRMNTLNSVKRSVSWGADIVEFDVSFRPDGTPVIIHNSAPSQNQGVLLEKALDEVVKSKTCKINLDIKSTKNLGAVDRLVKQKNLQKRVFYTGVFEEWIDEVKSKSKIPFYINCNPTSEESIQDEYIERIISKAKETGAIGINSNFRGVSEKMVSAVHNNGLLISLWTANKTPEMFIALELKPDNITTKNPHILKKLIK